MYNRTPQVRNQVWVRVLEEQIVSRENSTAKYGYLTYWHNDNAINKHN